MENSEKKEKKPDETPEIFQDEKEPTESLPEEIDVDERKDEITYVINLGRPSKLIISTQKKSVIWRDSKGKKWAVRVVMHRENDQESIVEANKLRLIQGEEKAFIYSDDKGHYISKKIKSFDFSFAVFDYPHINDYQIGTSKFNERLYTIMAGVYDQKTGKQLAPPIPARVDRRSDADHLLTTFSFVAECDEGGNIIGEEPQYMKQIPAKPIEGSIDWKNMQEMSMDQIPRKTKAEDRINAGPMPKDRESEEGEE